jgi:plasmid stabilization system protein ParE
VKVRYSPTAAKQLQDLYDYVALASGADRANVFVGSIVVYCERLAAFPRRGTK